jgi:hypothetical protein
METLVKTVLDAHGGLEHWKTFSSLSARLAQGGALWGLKGKAGVLDDTTVTIDLRKEHASHHPFGSEARKSSFTPQKVALLTPQDELIEELPQPRASFAGHTLETPWTDLQLAYFAGCAMWTYLTMPFLLASPGVVSKEIEPWLENGETWRRLEITFPDTIATHSTRQTLYVGEDGLLRRHDYNVEIAGDTPGAHYVSDYVEVQGLKFPTKRRIFPRGPDGQSMPEPLVVSIDLSDIVLT